MVSRQCNFHCRHCMVDSSHGYSWISDKILKRCYQMIELGKPDEVYLLGGEPLLHIEKVEAIVNQIKKMVSQITIFTNGSFLLNNNLAQKVKNLNVTIRISDDLFHREFWHEGFEKKLLESGYWIVSKDDAEDMIPVGRAYEEFKHLQYNMGCSLLTGRYDESYPNGHRYMVMMDGSVNLYCATIEGSLANVFEDEDITYDLLVRREKILHNYLMREVITCAEDTYMAVMCNRCSKYKVTEDHILYDNNVIADVKDYMNER